MAGSEKYNTYMRNYMRVRTGAVPRKERFAEHFANFRRIILAGGYGNVSDVCRQLGISTMSGSRWLRKIRKENP